MTRIRIGTRKSALALWQTEHVAGLLKAIDADATIEIMPFSTRGDEILDQSLPAIGGKGVFTEALEHALRVNQIDYAVHSLKDLPVEHSTGLTIGAITARGQVGDVLISKGGLTLDQLPHGAVIGTSSRRRSAQILAYRPDVVCVDIRGNVNTRIEKALTENSPYHATILAEAGVNRLGLSHHISQKLPLDLMLPAPGQGALAVQCRADEADLAYIGRIADIPTTLCTTLERVFLAQLGGGCALPVAAYATIEEGTVHLRGRICAVDGSRMIEVNGHAPADMTDGVQLATELAKRAISQGAKSLLVNL